MISKPIFLNKIKKTFFSIIVLYFILMISFLNSIYLINQSINSDNIYILSNAGNSILIINVIPIIFIYLIGLLENKGNNEIYYLIRMKSRKIFFIKNFFENIIMITIFYFSILIICITKLIYYNIDIFFNYKFEFFIIIKMYFSYFLYLLIFYCIFKLFVVISNSNKFSIIVVFFYYIYTVISKFSSFKFGISNYLFNIISIGTNEIFIKTTVYFSIIIIVLTAATFYIYINEDIDFEYKNKIK